MPGRSLGKMAAIQSAKATIRNEIANKIRKLTAEEKIIQSEVVVKKVLLMHSLLSIFQIFYCIDGFPYISLYLLNVGLIKFTERGYFFGLFRRYILLRYTNNMVFWSFEQF